MSALHHKLAWYSIFFLVLCSNVLPRIGVYSIGLEMWNKSFFVNKTIIRKQGWFFLGGAPLDASNLSNIWNIFHIQINLSWKSNAPWLLFVKLVWYSLMM